MTAIYGRMSSVWVKIVQINQICPRNLNHLATPCLSTIQHQHMETSLALISYQLILQGRISILFLMRLYLLYDINIKRSNFYPTMCGEWGNTTHDIHTLSGIFSLSLFHLQHCPKGISQFTPSYWTHMCTLLGKMQHVLPIFGWPNTWIAVACLAPCSLRRPECGTAVMESGRTFTFIALARLASPSKRTAKQKMCFRKIDVPPG